MILIFYDFPKLENSRISRISLYEGIQEFWYGGKDLKMLKFLNFEALFENSSGNFLNSNSNFELLAEIIFLGDDKMELEFERFWKL